jgi:hypothetical protein
MSKEFWKLVDGEWWMVNSGWVISVCGDCWNLDFDPCLNTNFNPPSTIHHSPNCIKKHHYPFPFPLLSGITSERIVDRTNYEHAKIR